MAADSTSSCAKQLEGGHRAVTPSPCSDPCPSPGGVSPRVCSSQSVTLGRCWAWSPTSPAEGSPWRWQQELLEEEEAAGMMGREIWHSVPEPLRSIKVKSALTI